MDATEKVLFICKSIQNKAYLLTLQYYMLYVKLVFQWRRVCVWGGVKRGMKNEAEADR